MNATSRSRFGSASKGTRFNGARHIFYFPLTGEAYAVSAATLDRDIRKTCRQAHTLRANWHIASARGLVSVHVFVPVRQRYDVSFEEARRIAENSA